MYMQATLSETISGLLGLEGVLGDVVGGLVGAFIIANIMLIMTAIAGPWAKRKITAAFGDRIAVNRIGPFGLLVIIPDAVRLLSKELIVPEGVDRPAWDLAPMIIPFSALLGFAVIPMGNGIQLADPETGLAFAFAVASIASLGLVMTGYASNNKFSLIGALRAVAANIAYEIPLVITAASVVIFTGSLQMSEIVAVQAEPLISVAGITIPTWFAFVNPFAFALFIVANLAEIGRNPFDIPEAPTEIVAGYQTEYSSVYFVLIYLGEFIHIFLGGAIAATLFLGGPAGPFLPGFVWFVIKIWAFFLFTQWARSAVPRLRVDQFLEVGWKGMLVLSFANLVLTAIIVGVIA
ncbi:NADH-quinone oxidoreductase subunit H [Haloferax mediterranei ATCC 33500]|uniref:NADH dehydrogenase n=1 Tax=Haloferax mediterranei (strain ATCC 33500 / DSM 1411 / JCM 8866 / NBRC 14739 / NCIMB 2177 / R-4) TaxID=523841 RepID=I3R387_HALMT|nr:complex I subunit 1 family protein [Haloferax mediterranei]AFK18697.1 NADH dehydrogenase, subunit H (ubiquinone) [Haloferax mediterranei ATCC 33500]AHZ21933.1 NADH dehydrogenase [Haloferax mediterranei ATCC 33500]EMA03442.1 NADH dehydrogenase, subunit H (ubiquinone) [Haloferax mediterranei ATCC 33500]MDX5988794.1 complex I subunit 1 family protein [Haloferax mediterranei ATCC 33500]QCQ75197.1 NADH-quinone oxidoreductase subunit H [Haloferax mediterranei ATCC 33500]